ncbi:MAG: exonuclease SbcCD subunit D [bacterium]
MKIVHLADIHLGYRAYSKLSSDGFNIREKDVLRAFNEALEKISKINPDLIIISGDVFHRPRPTNATIYNTIDLLLKFRKTCDSPIIMIAGNHETIKTTESGSILKIFGKIIPKIIVIDEHIESVPLGNLDASVLCVPYSGLSSLEKYNLKPDKSFKYNILAIHGTYQNIDKLAGYKESTIIKDSDIYEAEWNYIAFGHYHKFTRLAPNAYYSGAIERTTTNIWQEADDPKGFIEFDFDEKDEKKYTFHSLESPRPVTDIKKINAKDLTAEEINQKIIQETSKINNLDKSIVRLTFDNVDSIALREIDYKKIREFKKTAVYFKVNFIKKDISVTLNKNENGEIIEKKKNIFEYLEQELAQFELSQGIDREKFNRMAHDYLK